MSIWDEGMVWGAWCICFLIDGVVVVVGIRTQRVPQAYGRRLAPYGRGLSADGFSLRLVCISLSMYIYI